MTTGCSTLFRFAFDDDPSSCEMPPYVYGGTFINGSFIIGYLGPEMIPFGVVDLPFSLVGDTLLLPVSIPLQVNKVIETNCSY